MKGTSKELIDAVSALEVARAEPATVETVLPEAGAKLTAAKELDTQRAPELAAAETKTKKAKTDVVAAKAIYDFVDVHTSEETTVITRQSGGLARLSAPFSDADVGNVSQQVQLAGTLFSSSALELDELTSRKFQLDAIKKEADEAEAVTAEVRRVATEQLESSKQTGEAMKAKRVEIAEKVVQCDVTKVKANSQLTAEKGRQSELESESGEIDRRTQERIAQQKHAEGEQQTRERFFQQSGSSSPGSSSGSGSSFGLSKGLSFSDSLIHLMDGAVSSSCDVRVRPVLEYSRLHGGTDFAAGCGTPIRVVGDDVASGRYFNAGYGNRLMIGHGSKSSTYVTTECSHATSYVVSARDHVSQGQIIGYAGITDYSTGCHLHLMVWENDSATNSMSHWFS